MATWAYPPLASQAELDAAQLSAAARELQWYLASLQRSLAALRHSLQTCADLLAPTPQHASTLALSTPRSECVKGYVTRVGAAIVRGDILLQLGSLPPSPGGPSSRTASGGATRLAVAAATDGNPAAAPLQLGQLAAARRLVNDCLDVVDVSTYTGDATDASFIAGQLKLLHEQLTEAREALEGEGAEDGEDAWEGADIASDRRHDERQKGQSEPQAQASSEAAPVMTDKAWTHDSASPAAFDPPLHPDLSLHLAIRQAALVVCIRTLRSAKPHGSQASLTDFFKNTLFGHKPAQTHDESGLVFRYQESGPGPLAATAHASHHRNGDPAEEEEEAEQLERHARLVTVAEKVTVESQDPNLMSAMAKIKAMENEVSRWRCALATVMDANADDD